MTKWVEYFIASRMATSRHSSSKGAREGAVISSIATLAVALSLIVMILTLAVVLGFKSEVHSRLTALSGDIIISSSRGVNVGAAEPIARADAIEEIVMSTTSDHASTLRQINPYALRNGVVRSDEGVEGVVLKGVDSSFPTEIFRHGLIAGEVPQFGLPKKSRNVIISKELSTIMGLDIGARLELLVTNADGSIRRDLYRVAAIYSAAAGAAERAIIFTDLRNVQRLNNWREDQISGYEIGIAPRDNAIAIAHQINHDLIYSTNPALEESHPAAYATEQLYPTIFDWLDSLDLNALVVVVIMVVVAIFNIITAILILVLERMQMVGILKSLGMRDRAIARVFLHRASAIMLRGIAWGNAIGITIALLQRHFNIIKLDEAGYMLSSVPIELGVGWLLLLNGGVIAVILLSVMLPTRIVSSIEPHRAVKFQ